MNNETTTSRRAGRPRNSERTPERIPPAVAMREPEHGPEHHDVRERRRLRRSQEVQDELYIPVEEIPEGTTYEWKRFSVHGQEDPFYLARMREQGWEPVDPRLHPNWLPPGYDKPSIIKGGMILMERPAELTQEARREMNTMARQQIREAEQRLGMTPKDTLTRDYDGARPRVVKEVGRMVPTAIEE